MRIIILAFDLIFFNIGVSFSQVPSDTLAKKISLNSKLEISLVQNGQVYFTDSDFIFYSPSTYVLGLSKKGIDRWNSYIPHDKVSNGKYMCPKLGKHMGKQFVLKIDGNEIYRGIFYSRLSSTIMSSITIEDIIMQKDSLNNLVQIGLNINTSHPISDLRNDKRVAEFFRFKDKLKAAREEKTKSGGKK